MLSRQFIQIAPQDNVAVAVKQASAGTPVDEQIDTTEQIPEGHKVALRLITAGSAVIRYGVTIGYASKDILAGQWIREDMLSRPEAPGLDNLEWIAPPAVWLPEPPCSTFQGFPNPHGRFDGTRNILGIQMTVQCAAGVVGYAVEKIRHELLPKYPNVDGVVPLSHDFGCGVAIDAAEAEIPIRTLKNLKDNPNFGGEIMLIALGCEKLTPDMLLEPDQRTPENLILLQECGGFQDMVAKIMAMADSKLSRLNRRRRQTIPLSRLCIGIQCGGSDAFSGITANPAAGAASDLLVAAGATVLFSEVTEVRDAVHLLARRCTSEAVLRKLAAEMRWTDEYLAKCGVDSSSNPAPGNKKGGLSNVVEKTMGSIAKSGTAPIVEALAPGEKPSCSGLVFAATPASDFVCGTSQLASGMTLQVFTTGRGTPYGLAAAPVVKVSTRSSLKGLWRDLIDIDAGTIATGEATIAEVGEELFCYIVDVASGRKKPFAEQYGLANDLCVFNPAPIT
jgi:galactarate dehydratase